MKKLLKDLGDGGYIQDGLTRNTTLRPTTTLSYCLFLFSKPIFPTLVNEIFSPKNWSKITYLANSHMPYAWAPRMRTANPRLPPTPHMSSQQTGLSTLSYIADCPLRKRFTTTDQGRSQRPIMDPSSPMTGAPIEAWFLPGPSRSAAARLQAGRGLGNWCSFMSFSCSCFACFFCTNYKVTNIPDLCSLPLSPPSTGSGPKPSERA